MVHIQTNADQRLDFLHHFTSQYNTLSFLNHTLFSIQQLFQVFILCLNYLMHLLAPSSQNMASSAPLHGNSHQQGYLLLTFLHLLLQITQVSLTLPQKKMSFALNKCETLTPALDFIPYRIFGGLDLLLSISLLNPPQFPSHGSLLLHMIISSQLSHKVPVLLFHIFL